MLGQWKIHAIQAGGQKLDGGAMFGVVPKPLWEKRIHADERNRIPLGMRCLLIEHEDGPILIDTGAGNKEDAKFLDIYGIENAGAESRTMLEDGLKAAGFSTDDVRMVINSHLHFDHAGGNTFRDTAGLVRPTFGSANYVIQRKELEYATHTNERTAASYFPHNWESIRRAGQIHLVDGHTDLLEGITLLPSPGHTPHHQCILMQSAGEKALYLADLCPTAAHLPLPWIMGYDVEPLVTLESKRRLFKRALDEQWLLVFEHDATVAWGHLQHDGKNYRLGDATLP